LGDSCASSLDGSFVDISVVELPWLGVNVGVEVRWLVSVEVLLGQSVSSVAIVLGSLVNWFVVVDAGGSGHHSSGETSHVAAVNGIVVIGVGDLADW
jgi:hypothetical protein